MNDINTLVRELLYENKIDIDEIESIGFGA